jgi:hypothetical protein
VSDVSPALEVPSKRARKQSSLGSPSVEPLEKPGFTRIGRSKVNHVTVRKACVEWISAHSDCEFYSNFFAEPEHVEEVEGGYDNWVNKMVTLGTFGAERF